MAAQQSIPLSEAAIQLAMSYNQTLRLLLIRELKGYKRQGRWYVDAQDLRRLLGKRRDARRRHHGSPVADTTVRVNPR